VSVQLRVNYFFTFFIIELSSVSLDNNVFDLNSVVDFTIFPYSFYFSRNLTAAIGCCLWDVNFSSLHLDFSVVGLFNNVFF